MPATSRNGDDGWRRSSTGRSGSPSKSSTIQWRCEAQHLAQVEVAVDADGHAQVVGRYAVGRRPTSIRCVSRWPDETRSSCAPMSEARAAPSVGSDPNASPSATWRSATVSPSGPGLVDEVELAVPGSEAALEHLPQRGEGQLDPVTPASLEPTHHREVGAALAPRRDRHRHPSVAEPAEGLGHLDVGIAPGSTRRNSFMMYRSSSTSDVFDCSPGCGPDGRERAGRERPVRERQRELVVAQRVEQVGVAPGGADAGRECAQSGSSSGWSGVAPSGNWYSPARRRRGRPAPRSAPTGGWASRR